MHTDAPAPLYFVSLPQAVHDADVPDEYLPALQGLIVRVPLQVLPAGHVVHAVFEVESPVVKLPGPHVAHSLFAAPAE